MSITGMKAIYTPAGLGKAKTELKTNTDQSKAIGCNTYFGSIIKLDIEYYKSHPTSMDYHKDALIYANTIGMKIYFILSADEYASYNTVWDTPSLTDAYINNLAWVLARYKPYPAFAGVYIHEPYYHNVSFIASEMQRRKDKLNTLWVRLRQTVDAANMPAGFELISTYGTNAECNIGTNGGINGMGVDTNYLSNNFTRKLCGNITDTRNRNELNKPLFTSYSVRNVQSYVGLWLLRFPGIQQMQVIDITLSSVLQSANCLAGIKTACRLQGFFDGLKKAYTDHTPFQIFSLGSARTSPNEYWTAAVNAAYPGNGAMEKIKNILDVTCPQLNVTMTF